MHGASYGEVQVTSEENPSGDPAGRHPQLPWLTWDLLQDFQNINKTEIQQLPSICPCETPELMFPASPSLFLPFPASPSLFPPQESQQTSILKSVLRTWWTESRRRSPQDCQGQGYLQLGAQKKRGQHQLSFSSCRETKGGDSYRPLALFNLSAIFHFCLLF